MTLLLCIFCSCEG